MTRARLFGCTCLALTAIAATPSCGTLLYPERQNESHSGRVDPNLLILDGIGLLFFLVPGLVAFGVDFATGAIYLPDGVEKGEGPFLRDRQADEPDGDDD